ncbi:Renal dipeptidase [Peribacillus simplex]|nr:Renal dipeptidase [Peribacillus simplex]
MNNDFSLDLASVSKELKFIFEILKMRNDSSKVLEKIPTDINWVHFLELVKHHRLYPLIYSILKKSNVKLIPSYIIQSLYREYKANTFQMLHLSAEMEQISKLFTENKIRLLFLKGPVIAHELYGDISLRTSKDLDIIIQMSDLKKTEELLLSFGYEREENPTLLREWKWRHHHVTYFHPQRKIQIEIHWRLNPFPSKEPSFNKLWDGKRLSMLTTYPVYFLGEEDLFLYLISHGSRHGWFRLRWLTDIDQMIRNGLCMKRIILLINKYQYHRIGGQAFILASQLLYTPIDEKLSKLTLGQYSRKLASESLSFIKEMSDFQSPKKYMQSLKTNQQKVLSLLISFYPRYMDSLTLRLPKPIHFLYFPLRPFLLIWRKMRKVVLPSR